MHVKCHTSPHVTLHVTITRHSRFTLAISVTQIHHLAPAIGSIEQAADHLQDGETQPTDIRFRFTVWELNCAAAATCAGVRPNLFGTHTTRGSLATMSAATGPWPLDAATCAGVSPLTSAARVLALWFSSTWAAVSFPCTFGICYKKSLREGTLTHSTHVQRGAKLPVGQLEVFQVGANEGVDGLWIGAGLE